MRHFILILYMCMLASSLVACRPESKLVRGGDTKAAYTEDSGSGEEDLVDGSGSDEERPTDEKSASGEEDLTDGSGSDEERLAAVYVCGAVVNPGVYYMDKNSIKQDAVFLAGGFKEGACEEYINLAEHIKDGEQIYIPFYEELSADYSPLYDAHYSGDKSDDESKDYEEGRSKESEDYEDDKSEASYDKDGKLNINYASKEELMSLSGIGEARALAIIQYREQHGSFKSIEEIMNISGIKDSVFNNIKDFITVG